MIDILTYVGILMAAASGAFLATALYLGSRRSEDGRGGDLQREVGAWGEHALVHATPVGLASCLQDAAEELHTEVRILGNREPGAGNAHDRAVRYVAEEAAECYLLLLLLAYRTGFDLEEEARARHADNRDRGEVSSDLTRGAGRVRWLVERSSAPTPAAGRGRGGVPADLRVVSSRQR